MKIFSEIIEGVKKEVINDLPGMEAHLTMTPYRRLTKTIPEKTNEASVLLLLYEREGTVYFPLILRESYNGVHSSQMSFPGGRKDAVDESFYKTAVRETYEEIGVPHNEVNFIGELSTIYIPPSNFMVYPYIGFLKNPVNFIKDTREVVEIVEVPLLKLLNDDLVRETTVQLSSKMKLKTPYFDLEDRVVWGATAAILAEFKVLLKNVL